MHEPLLSSLRKSSRPECLENNNMSNECHPHEKLKLVIIQYQHSLRGLRFNGSKKSLFGFLAKLLAWRSVYKLTESSLLSLNIFRSAGKSMWEGHD